MQGDVAGCMCREKQLFIINARRTRQAEAGSKAGRESPEQETTRLQRHNHGNQTWKQRLGYMLDKRHRCNRNVLTLWSGDWWFLVSVMPRTRSSMTRSLKGQSVLSGRCGILVMLEPIIGICKLIHTEGADSAFWRKHVTAFVLPDW